MDINVVEQIYKLRNDFIVIGLTGRTGSGCTAVASILSSDISSLKSNFKDFNDKNIDNDVRKDRIIDRFIRQHWEVPFTSIKASDVIFYYALLEEFDDFKKSVINPKNLPNDKFNNETKSDASLSNAIDKIQPTFEKVHNEVLKCDEILEGKKYTNNKGEFDQKGIEQCKKLLKETIPQFRKELHGYLEQTTLRIMGSVLQCWGNNIRKYNNIVGEERTGTPNSAPSNLAHKVNMFIKAFRALDKQGKRPTHIVIDALRNPYEVLYFQERYSAFYLMSVNTTEKIRKDKLYNKGYRKEEIDKIDKEESGQDKGDLSDEYSQINIDRCIELSDIHLTHDGTNEKYNHDLVNQIFKYVSLILHPGLVPPSPLERCMQVAFTAKLNSGCLSRQVGAAVTNEFFSIRSIGWNTVAEGQTPCNLRCLQDLATEEDVNAFSNYERFYEPFNNYIQKLSDVYNTSERQKALKGLTVSYCFKDIHNTVDRKHFYNQVHTRSLHAEENAFLQLAKYGSTGIKGGKLFTTASCCELCAKKAYQLGIKEIYYIDTYPGISQSHILESGDMEHRPQMKLFHGAIGRAYINLYNPFIPLKDEIKARTGINPKDLNGTRDKESSTLKTKTDGTNNNNK